MVDNCKCREENNDGLSPPVDSKKSSIDQDNVKRPLDENVITHFSKSTDQWSISSAQDAACQLQGTSLVDHDSDIGFIDSDSEKNEVVSGDLGSNLGDHDPDLVSFDSDLELDQTIIKISHFDLNSNESNLRKLGSDFEVFATSSDINSDSEVLEADGQTFKYNFEDFKDDLLSDVTFTKDLIAQDNFLGTCACEILNGIENDRDYRESGLKYKFVDGEFNAGEIIYEALKAIDSHDNDLQNSSNIPPIATTLNSATSPDISLFNKEILECEASNTLLVNSSNEAPVNDPLVYQNVTLANQSLAVRGPFRRCYQTYQPTCTTTLRRTSLSSRNTSSVPGNSNSVGRRKSSRSCVKKKSSPKTTVSKAEVGSSSSSSSLPPVKVKKPASKKDKKCLKCKCGRNPEDEYARLRVSAVGIDLVRSKLRETFWKTFGPAIQKQDDIEYRKHYGDDTSDTDDSDDDMMPFLYSHNRLNIKKEKHPEQDYVVPSRNTCPSYEDNWCKRMAEEKLRRKKALLEQAKNEREGDEGAGGGEGDEGAGGAPGKQSMEEIGENAAAPEKMILEKSPSLKISKQNVLNQRASFNDKVKFQASKQSTKDFISTRLGLKTTPQQKNASFKQSESAVESNTGDKKNSPAEREPSTSKGAAMIPKAFPVSEKKGSSIDRRPSAVVPKASVSEKKGSSIDRRASSMMPKTSLVSETKRSSIERRASAMMPRASLVSEKKGSSSDRRPSTLERKGSSSNRRRSGQSKIRCKTALTPNLENSPDSFLVAKENVRIAEGNVNVAAENFKIAEYNRLIAEANLEGFEEAQIPTFGKIRRSVYNNGDSEINFMIAEDNVREAEENLEIADRSLKIAKLNEFTTQRKDRMNENLKTDSDTSRDSKFSTTRKSDNYELALRNPLCAKQNLLVAQQNLEIARRSINGSEKKLSHLDDDIVDFDEYILSCQESLKIAQRK